MTIQTCYVHIHPHKKAIISEMGKAMSFRFCTHIHRIDRNKSH